MNEEKNENLNEQTATFQKIWLETLTKSMQAAFTFSPSSPPPEVFRQIRSGIFQALAESWEKFMRSPEFLETMKQGMEQAVTFRKMSNDFMGKARHEMQAPSREDIDTIMLAVRHMEKRLLDRLDQMSAPPNGSTHKPFEQKERKSGAKATRTKSRSAKRSRATQAQTEAQ